MAGTTNAITAAHRRQRSSRMSFGGGPPEFGRIRTLFISEIRSLPNWTLTENRPAESAEGIINFGAFPTDIVDGNATPNTAVAAIDRVVT